MAPEKETMSSERFYLRKTYSHDVFSVIFASPIGNVFYKIRKYVSYSRNLSDKLVEVYEY